MVQGRAGSYGTLDKRILRMVLRYKINGRFILYVHPYSSCGCVMYRIFNPIGNALNVLPGSTSNDCDIQRH